MGQQSLTERLGYGPDDRLLIVNCDDLGVSHAANVATWRALAYGAATSATLMVPCPWAREAARMCGDFSIGVHLTLTSEYRGYRWRGLTGSGSLRDREGFFPATAKEALARIDPAEARVECRAQIETALSWGVDVTHIDTHMNILQTRSDLFDVYLDLADEFQLPARMFSREETEKNGFRARAEAPGVLFNEHIVYPWPRRTREVFFEEIPRLPVGVSEIFAHPVLDGDELRGYDSGYADIRTHDAACLIDPSITALLDEHRIRRIGYREIRALRRGATQAGTVRPAPSS